MHSTFATRAALLRGPAEPGLATTFATRAALLRGTAEPGLATTFATRAALLRGPAEPGLATTSATRAALLRGPAEPGLARTSAARPAVLRSRLGLVRLALVGGLLAVGCGGRYGGAATSAPAMRGKATAPKGGLASAALPFHVLDGRTGRQLDEAAFWERVGAARAVCIGEEHPNPHHHWVQLHVVEQLGKRGAKRGRLGLGMEMIQRPFQGVLDDYAARRIDDTALRSRVGWEERWGYDWGFYGPTIDAARNAGAALLALNASRELAKKISRHGLESLTPDERALVPELKLDDAAHRGWFDALMNDMGGHAAHAQQAQPRAATPDPHASPSAAAPAMPTAERIYTVQVLWDETMAELSARWLAANPDGTLVILAGNGHCHDSAIVGRLKRRGVADVISLRPVIDTEGQVAEVLAKPMNDLVIVMTLPAAAR